ncbi:lipase member H-like [Cardiocondyla obscurior]|uniref:lipase member H-like n=1 Tax=Cardiocondyla obscurior TaxID=286306 RepID=UPI0039657BAC
MKTLKFDTFEGGTNIYTLEESAEQALFLIQCVYYFSGNLPNSDFASGINLLYYKCNNETPATISYPITEPQSLLNDLDPNKRIIFYIFGNMQYPTHENVKLMINALCYGQTDNVVLLDWSRYSNGSDSIVFKNGEKVGRLFAQSIQLLVNSGANLSKIYIIGYFLGAHIAGIVGKCNFFEIPRITGLDPAIPFFYPSGCYLRSNDAAWVDVIHTDMGEYGTLFSTGTADYYVTDGFRPQPNCSLISIPLSPQDLCSYQASVKVYADSKYKTATYDAEKCASYIQYRLNTILNRCVKIEIGIGYNATNM